MIGHAVGGIESAFLIFACGDLSLAEQSLAGSIHGKQGPQQVFEGSLADFMVGRVKQAARTIEHLLRCCSWVMQIVLLCKAVDVVYGLSKVHRITCSG